MRRHLGWTAVTAAAVLCAAFTARKLSVTMPRAEAQSRPQPQLINVSAPTSKTAPSGPPSLVVPLGSELYIAQKGESVIGVSRRYLARTSFMTSGELAEAIRRANNGYRGTFFRAGQQVIVPGMLSAPILEKPRAVQKDFEVRAIYLTGLMAGSDHGLRTIQRWRDNGGNAVVFDIKDSDGSVNVPFEHPLLGKHHTPIQSLPKLVHFLHTRNIHAIARIAIFRDERLVQEHPELAVKSHKTGQAWRENGKLVWTDPSQEKVQEFNIALAKKAAEAGVDEVQFDYVRFPAEGDQKDASFVFQTDHPNWQRPDVITDFLKRAYGELHSAGVLLSLDVFGVMAWQRPVDLAHTGQDIVAMAKYCDVLSPMIYPSHFFGMDGYDRPGDAPEHFISVSMDRFQTITRGSGVVVRPWLQAFYWRTRSYSPKYIEVQVLTAKNKGGIGFLFWNAANDYSMPFAAMAEMRATKGEYLRGDEFGEPPQRTAAVNGGKLGTP